MPDISYRTVRLYIEKYYICFIIVYIYHKNIWFLVKNSVYLYYKIDKMKVEDFVFDTFLRLTSKTVPYGSEDRLVSSMRDLFPKDIKKDEWGNYFYKIGESRSIFASHLDTVSKEYANVTHVFDGDIIKTDGKTTLGADDKAGITVLLWMIKNKIPGVYYFFIGEEVGCIGSGNAAKYGKFKGEYDRIISFDRRDCNSVITYQSSSRCCSNSFAESLVNEFNKNGMNYRTDDGGVYTDSAEFTHLIPECTNISVGYYKEHTTSENQNIIHLTNLAESCTKVDWENLPTKRDITKNDYKSYGCTGTYGSYGKSNWISRGHSYYDDFYDDDEDQNLSDMRIDRKKSKKSKKYFDNGSDLIDITEPIEDEIGEVEEDDFYSVTPIEKILNSDSKYDWILSNFTHTNMEQWELNIIKEQYLDMDIAYDKFFYDYLLEKMYDYGY